MNATTLAAGAPAAVTDANGNATSFAYSSRSSRISETDALGGVTQYGYDLAGNRTTVTDPKGAPWTYEFNAHNRQKKLTQPDGRIERLYHDPNGNLVKKIDGVPPGPGATILYEHDKLGRLTKKDDLRWTPLSRPALRQLLAATQPGPTRSRGGAAWARALHMGTTRPLAAGACVAFLVGLGFLIRRIRRPPPQRPASDA